MQKPLRVGIVGAGFFSQFHLDGWRRVPDVEVAVLCDTDLDRARTVGERYGVKQTTGDLDQVLSQPLDLIDIITPPATHQAIVSTLLAKRIPLICQKPFGRTLGEATALTDLAERQQTALIIHENFRFAPWFREIKRLVNAGHFGSLHAISFRLRPGDGQGPRAYLDRQPYFQTMPRLLIRETAIHFVDTFRFLFGEVRSVSAHLRRLNPVIAGEDAGYVQFDFMNGASGLFDGNRLNGHPARELRRTMGEAWIEGSAGVMRLDGDARLWWLPHGGEEREHNYDHGLPTFAGGACGALCAHVADHLRHGSALENSARDYLRNLVIEDAIYQSNEQRRVVVLPELTS